MLRYLSRVRMTLRITHSLFYIANSVKKYLKYTKLLIHVTFWKFCEKTLKNNWA